MDRDIQIYSRQQQINRKKQIPCTKQIFSLRCFTPANETMAACYIFCPIQYNLSNLKWCAKLKIHGAYITVSKTTIRKINDKVIAAK